MRVGGGHAGVGTRRLSRGEDLERREIGRVAGPEYRFWHVQDELRPVRLEPGGVLVAHDLKQGLSREFGQAARPSKVYFTRAVDRSATAGSPILARFAKVFAIQRSEGL